MSRYERFPYFLRPFGLLFVSVSLFVLYHVWLDAMDLALTAVLPCLLAGSILLAGRCVLEVLEEPARVSLRVGIGVPILTAWSHDLHACDALWIRFRHDDDMTGYLVGITARNQERILFTDCDLLVVRGLAEKLSQLTGLGIEDEATGSGYREAGTMDEPLRQRLLRHGLAPLDAAPPRLVVEQAAGELRVTLPEGPFIAQLGLAMPWLFFFALLLMVPTIRVFALHESLRNSPSALWVVDGFCVLSVIAAGFFLARMIREIGRIELTSSVMASNEGIKLTVQSPLGIRMQALSADAIESLGVGYRRQLTYFASQGPQRVLAVADNAVLSFGAGCTEAERSWLIRAISHALCDR